MAFNSVPLALCLAALIVFVSSAQASPHPSYASFAQPISAYQLSTGNVQFATDTEQKALSLSVSDDAVYIYAYVSTDGSSWQNITLSGKALGGLWLNGSVSGQLSFRAENFSLSQSRLSAARNFVVVYTCSRTADGTAWDCHSGWQIWQFNATMQAAPPPETCTDGIRNQGETGVDCGGPCPACPTCSDGIRNQDETGVDCGGAVCPACQPVQDARITGVSASSYQPGSSYFAENTLDGSLDPESRWSVEGDGQWIMYTNTGPAYVDEVRIAFYKGNVRTTTFSVELSTDGSSWTRVLDHRVSSGATLGYETFTFAGRQAARIRILGHGNSDPQSVGWTSITEARVEDFGIELACVPESAAVTCAGRCGTQQNNCGQSVSCAACPSCTDGVRNGDETGIDCGGSCPACTAPSPYCGDTICNGAETCSSCPGDCGACMWCGDGTCNNGETCSTCAGDCGSCSGGSIFDVKFSQDFNDDTLGIYRLNELYQDFYTTYTPDAYGSDLITIEMKDGSKVCRNRYPAGQYGTQGNGGTGTIFESYPGGMVGQTELYLSYNLYFEDGFDWGLGGKLPGLLGKPMPISGTHITYDQAFRVMFMWQGQGDVHFYCYDHDNPTIYGRSNGVFGTPLPRGEWVSLTMRLSLNDVGSKNGFLEAYVNGRLVKQWSGLNFRNHNYDIDTLYVETFMGGNDISWAPDHTQYMWMDDFFVYKYKPGTPGVPAERSMNSPGATIPLPNWPKP